MSDLDIRSLLFAMRDAFRSPAARRASAQELYDRLAAGSPVPTPWSRAALLRMCHDQLRDTTTYEEDIFRGER